MAVTLLEIQKTVALQMGRRKVGPSDRFQEDLAAESADIVNIIATVEDKFDISFDQTDIAAITTVEELFEAAIKEAGG